MEMLKLANKSPTRSRSPARKKLNPALKTSAKNINSNEKLYATSFDRQLGNRIKNEVHFKTGRFKYKK